MSAKNKVAKAISILRKRGYKIFSYEVTENIAKTAPKVGTFYDIIRGEQGEQILRQTIASVDESSVVAFAEWWGDKVLYVNTQTFEVRY